MRGKIRAVNFSPTSDKIIRREVGRRVQGIGISVDSIDRVDNEKTGIPTFYIYARNDKGEISLWKETVCPDYDVEYDVINILT